MNLIKPRTVAIFALVGLSGFALLHISQTVRNAEKRLISLKSSIEREEEQIRMLNAEWEHLNRPERLEKLTREFLDLAPPPTEHMVKEDVFMLPLPQEEPQARPASTATPPPIKKPVKPAPQKLEKKKTKDFGALLDELSEEGGAP